MPTALARNHAMVHTATIDVKIVRLDKKQVTLSVFRQLDEEPILQQDGSLRGTPWGRVGYRWKGNRKGTAFHIIWQDGELLKRCAVPKLDIDWELNRMRAQDWIWECDEHYDVETVANALIEWVAAMKRLDQLFIGV